MGPEFSSLYKNNTCIIPRYPYISFRKDIMETEQLKRIADAIEEILRLVKKDMEPKKK